MPHRTTLGVPAADEARVRVLGARWSPTLKQWYVPPHLATRPFLRWLPLSPGEPGSEICQEHLDWLPCSPAIFFESIRCEDCGLVSVFYYAEAVESGPTTIDSASGLYSQAVIDQVEAYRRAWVLPEPFSLPQANLRLCFSEEFDTAAVLQCCSRCNAPFESHDLFDEIISQCTNPTKAPSFRLDTSEIGRAPEDCEHTWTFNLPTDASVTPTTGTTL